ncbi:MAG: hypothetical protein KJP26_08170 [Maribacter sp.]|nr:hypothetical protein [Maribacter sp.]
MNIKYNEKEQAIEIKDGLKAPYTILKILMIMNILNAILNLYNTREEQLGWMGYVWIVLGVLSFVILLYLIFKKSTQDKIPLNDITGLREKSVFGRKRFSLILKNGKMRDLIKLKSQADITELKNLVSEVGIVKN